MSDPNNHELEASPLARAVDIRAMTSTLEKAVADGAVRVSVVSGLSSGEELMLQLSWPACPFFGRILTDFAPLDSEHYPHPALPECPPAVFVSPEEVTALAMYRRCMAGLAEGHMVCPVTGKPEGVRLYDHTVAYASAGRDYSFSLCFSSPLARWKLVIGSSAAGGMSCSIADIELRQDTAT